MLRGWQKQRQRELDPFQNLKKRKLQRSYQEGEAAFGLFRNLQKASGLSSSKVISFLHAKNSYTKYCQATWHFRRLPAFAKPMNEIWCLDLAFMDKLSEFDNGVKYLLFCGDVFSRFVRVQLMKSKTSTGAVAAFKKKLQKKPHPKKRMGWSRNRVWWRISETLWTKEIKIYSTRSETKAAVAERAITSLKNIIYRFIEENGCKYLVKMSSFLITKKSIVNRFFR